MRTEHHIQKSTLLDYAAGRLSEPLSVVAASHLAWCRECRQTVEAAPTTGPGGQDVSLAALPGEPARPSQTALKARDRLPEAAEMVASEVGDFGLPLPLALRLDGGLEDLTWRKVLPGVAIYNLALAPGTGGQLRLVRMAPGKALPQHGHAGSELSLVLRGAYRDQNGRYTIGDVADLDGTAAHRLVAEDTGPCVCLVASDGPVRYRSWLARLWQRLGGL